MSSRPERRIIRMLEEFKMNLNGRTIKNYFDIQQNVDFKLKKHKEHSCLFSFKYGEDPFIYNISNLPQDINRYIKTFINKNYIVRFDLNFPEDYPFKPPQWELNSPIINKQLNKEIDCIIKIHNYKYKNDWSPWIMIEKDVLFMIESLLKIDYSKL
jgi:ubiquitin-protein ligase